jgi:hypothetical protein
VAGRKIRKIKVGRRLKKKKIMPDGILLLLSEQKFKNLKQTAIP